MEDGRGRRRRRGRIRRAARRLVLRRRPSGRACRSPFCWRRPCSRAAGWPPTSAPALTSPDDLCFPQPRRHGRSARPRRPRRRHADHALHITSVVALRRHDPPAFDFTMRSGGGAVYRGDHQLRLLLAAGPGAAGRRSATRRCMSRAGEAGRGPSFDYPDRCALPRTTRLRMIDRIEVFLPDGGPHGLGLHARRPGRRPVGVVLPGPLLSRSGLPRLAGPGIAAAAAQSRGRGALGRRAGAAASVAVIGATAPLALPRAGAAAQTAASSVQAVVTAATTDSPWSRRTVSSGWTGRSIYQMNDFTLQVTGRRLMKYSRVYHRRDRLRAAAGGGDVAGTGRPAAPVYQALRYARGPARSADRHRRAALVGARASRSRRGRRGGAQGAGAVQRPAAGPGRADLRRPSAASSSSRPRPAGWRRPSAISPTRVYDLSNACLGVLNGIVEIANRIELGQVRAGLVVSCETAREINDTMIETMLQTRSMDDVQDLAGHADRRLGGGRRAGHGRLVRSEPAAAAAGRHDAGGAAVPRPVPLGHRDHAQRRPHSSCPPTRWPCSSTASSWACAPGALPQAARLGQRHGGQGHLPPGRLQPPRPDPQGARASHPHKEYSTYPTWATSARCRCR